MQVGRWPRLILISILVATGLAAALGVATTWPDRAQLAEVQSQVDLSVPGVTSPGWSPT